MNKTITSSQESTPKTCKCCEALGIADEIRWLAEQDEKRELRKQSKNNSLKTPAQTKKELLGNESQ